MEENTHIIGLEEAKTLITKIDKKIILVNSSKYTEEAFEYILDLIDDNESIAFIINERKIYTHGEYFGGDLWEDTLNYFSKYTLLDDNNSITSQLYAQNSKDAIQLKGEGGIEIYSDYDISREANTIHIKYDLDTAIDNSSIVEISGEYLTLSVNDKKLALAKYDPIKVNLPKLQMIEYDKGNTEISFTLNIDGAERLKTLNISASSNAIPNYNHQNKLLTVTIMNNAKTIIYVDFSDGKLSSTESTTQDWGYAFAYGDEPINENTFDSLKKSSDLENSFKEKTLNISIRDGHFGWFAYPANVELKFTDVENGFSGGWEKYSTFTKYSYGIEYQVYRTEHTGLGKTKWKIVKK